jgi:hypothetical protein
MGQTWSQKEELGPGPFSSSYQKPGGQVSPGQCMASVRLALLPEPLAGAQVAVQMSVVNLMEPTGETP